MGKGVGEACKHDDRLCKTHSLDKAKCILYVCIMQKTDLEARRAAGIRLEQARLRRGFVSAAAACEAFGFTYVTYTQHESGQRGISRAAADYAQAFGVSAGWLLTGEGAGPGMAEALPLFTNVPLVSWVSAGQLSDQDAIVDFTDSQVVQVADLPRGDWIALRVDGDSMNKISPPDSIIFVDRRDRHLVPNACYVIADETGAATYKRYRPGDRPEFQPASYKDIDPPRLEGAITVIGRVRRSMIEM
jgi:SOS-response transcriptional repressor LexA